MNRRHSAGTMTMSIPALTAAATSSSVNPRFPSISSMPL